MFGKALILLAALGMLRSFVPALLTDTVRAERIYVARVVAVSKDDCKVELKPIEPIKGQLPDAKSFKFTYCPGIQFYGSKRVTGSFAVGQKDVIVERERIPVPIWPRYWDEGLENFSLEARLRHVSKILDVSDATLSVEERTSKVVAMIDAEDGVEAAFGAMLASGRVGTAVIPVDPETVAAAVVRNMGKDKGYAQMFLISFAEQRAADNRLKPETLRGLHDGLTAAGRKIPKWAKPQPERRRGL